MRRTLSKSAIVADLRRTCRVPSSMLAERGALQGATQLQKGGWFIAFCFIEFIGLERPRQAPPP